MEADRVVAWLESHPGIVVTMCTGDKGYPVAPYVTLRFSAKRYGSLQNKMVRGESLSEVVDRAISLQYLSLQARNQTAPQTPSEFEG